MAIHDTFYTNEFEDVIGFYMHADVRGQVEFIERIVQLEPKDRVLDLACGFGRHAILLAKKGHDVTGYDQSADYIERAKKSAQKANVNTLFACTDMRQLDVVERFDVVLSMSTSLAFYNDGVNEDIFRRIHKAVKPGGRFLFDQANIFWLVSWIMSGNQSKTEQLPDGAMHHRTYSFDAGKCIVSMRCTLERGEERAESGWDLRYYTLPELNSLASHIGFGVLNTYGDYDCSPFRAESRRLITVMKKL